ncbi:ProQ/FINO family protein [Vreelandella alkaliphila]|uniref:ABC transporter substrate-binding protein n=1 Tax=Vreelandella alkaliphila TaxID=272774 RepID=A0ABX4HDQ4_9GAMM|nr:ProQ/FINO family protein [Halomonas humidisoli]PAU70552.1 ABC transporter substrate-binding protein [Halomonas humidisoli]
MAATVLDLLETLETHLEQTKAALNALREENEMLKRQLANQMPQAQPPSQPLQDPAQSDVSAVEPSAVDAKPSSEKSDSMAVEQTPEEALASRFMSEEKVTAETAAAPQPPSPQALLRQWYKRYPQAFFTGHTKPLKVGIHQDLALREPWSGKLIRRALANYVNLPRYVKSMREGAERIDLDGNSAGKVDKEAARHASERRKDKLDSNTPRQAPQSSENRKSQQSSKQSSRQVLQEAPKNPTPAAVKEHEHRGMHEAKEKVEAAKPLSLEDKLRGLQQKFTGR